MATWGEFQSVIQLSVALNAAYAALGSFIGTDLPREKRLLKELEDRVDSVRTTRLESNANREKARKDLIAIRSLAGAAVKLERWYDGVINRYIRPICILASLSGIFLLVVSSCLYGDEIGGWMQSTCCALLFPFSAGAAIGLHVSLKIRVRISKSRRSLEKQYN